jgi:hypothetical protein
VVKGMGVPNLGESGREERVVEREKWIGGMSTVSGMGWVIYARSRGISNLHLLSSWKLYFSEYLAVAPSILNPRWWTHPRLVPCPPRLRAVLGESTVSRAASHFLKTSESTQRADVRCQWQLASRCRSVAVSPRKERPY